MEFTYKVAYVYKIIDKFLKFVVIFSCLSSQLKVSSQ